MDKKSYVIGKDIISFGFLLFMKMKASDEQRAIKGNNSSHKNLHHREIKYISVNTIEKESCSWHNENSTNYSICKLGK